MRRRSIVLLLAVAASAAALPAIAETQKSDTRAPSASGGLTATVRSGHVALHWNASSDNVGVAGYNVWRRDNPGSNWSLIAQTQALSYTDTAVAAGKNYAYGVRAYDAVGNVSAASAIVTATVPAVVGSFTAVPAVTADMGATGYRRLVKPAFTPSSKVTATTPARFATDLANLQAGEELDVQAMTIPGEFLISKKLSSYAEIHFAPGVVFSGATDFGYYTVQISNSSNIRLYGGDVSNPRNGSCVRVNDSTNVLWWHFKFHDCAATGFFVTSINASSRGLDFDGEIYHVAYNTAFDPHREKCTGIHGAYLGATWQKQTVAASGKFSLYVHDAECGAAVQAGSNLVNTSLWVKADHIPYQAQEQTAGNAIQFWGGDLHNITVHDVVGNDLAGRVVETGGMYSCCDSNIFVQYGRATNTLRNPLISRVNYETNPAVTYQHALPLP